MPVRVGIVVADITHLNQGLQVLQLPVPQLAQALPPTGVVSPLSSVEKQAKLRGITVETLINLWIQQKLAEQMQPAVEQKKA